MSAAARRTGTPGWLEGSAQGWLPLVLAFAGIAAAAVCMSLRESLWEDEVISITHGLQSGWLFFSQILRNDIHQFVYYLLLKGWTSLNHASDTWALGSSLLLMTLNAALMGWLVAREHGRQEALWAVAVFCVLPTFSWSASNLRMYSLIPGLVMLAWYLNRQVWRKPGWGGLASMVLLELLVIGTHAIGFYFLVFIAATEMVRAWPSASALARRRWVGAHALVALVAIPMALGTSLRGTPMHVIQVDWHTLLSVGVGLMYPEGTGEAELVSWIGYAVFPLLLALGWRQPDTRLLLVGVPVAALAVGLLVSALGKPMFRPPVYAAHLVPFIAICAGVGIARLTSPWWKATAIAAALLLVTANWMWVLHTRTPENFKPAGTHLMQHAQAGDVVVVPSLSVFWGVLRYSHEPSWGQPLEVMPLDTNPAWQRVKRRLGPELSEWMGLNVRTDTVDVRGVRYVITQSPTISPPPGGRTWVVHRARYLKPVDLPSPGRIVSVSWFGDEISITEVQAEAGGLRTIDNPRR